MLELLELWKFERFGGFGSGIGVGVGLEAVEHWR